MREAISRIEARAKAQAKAPPSGVAWPNRAVGRCHHVWSPVVTHPGGGGSFRRGVIAIIGGGSVTEVCVCVCVCVCLKVAGSTFPFSQALALHGVTGAGGSGFGKSLARGGRIHPEELIDV